MYFTHISGKIVRLYRSDGGRFPEWHIAAYSFLTYKFLQLSDWRIGDFDSLHLSVSHKHGNTAFVYKRDGTAHPGSRLDFGTLNLNIGAWNLSKFPVKNFLHGSADGCSTRKYLNHVVSQ